MVNAVTTRKAWGSIARVAQRHQDRAPGMVCGAAWRSMIVATIAARRVTAR
jgi:hypothetical protein